MNWWYSISNCWTNIIFSFHTSSTGIYMSVICFKLSVTVLIGYTFILGINVSNQIWCWNHLQYIQNVPEVFISEILCLFFFWCECGEFNELFNIFHVQWSSNLQKIRASLTCWDIPQFHCWSLRTPPSLYNWAKWGALIDEILGYMDWNFISIRNFFPFIGYHSCQLLVVPFLYYQ